MRSVPRIGRRKSGKFRGRHEAPSLLRSPALRAGLLAPAVALAVIAVVPRASGAGDAGTPRLASASFVYPSHGQTMANIGPLRGRYATGSLPLVRTASHLRREAAVHHRRARHTTHRVSCRGGGMVPANYQAIVRFLLAHGYTPNAAAGIAGNIYQESGGNPESVGTGGGGLIGWTPLPGGMVTGNPAADLRTQLRAILSFNQLWAQYIPMLNSAASPAAAADIYVTYFERAGIPASSSRETAAASVAAACHL